jgi:type I restriction enzyme S subunit
MPYLMVDGLRGGSHVYTEATALPTVSKTDTVLIADGFKSGEAVRGVAGALGSTLLGARPRPGVHASFLFHTLASLFPYLNGTFIGTSVRHLDQDLLAKLPLAVPPPEEQVAIARILDAVDTALERTRAAVERARELRKSLLTELLSRGIGADGKVRHATSRTRDFVQTPLGKLPAAWRLSVVAHEFELQNGFTLNTDRRARFKRRRYLRVANVQRDALDLSDVQELEAGDSEFAPRVLEVNDLLVVEGHADRMQIGRCARVTPEAWGMTFQNHLFRLRTKGAVVPEFACLWLNSAYAQRFWNARCGTSSGLNTINQRMLKRLVIPVPALAEQDTIAELAKRQRRHVEALAAKQLRLEALKKSLMHDLLTGRVRVRDTSKVGAT